MTTTVQVTYGTVSYKTGLDATPSTLHEGTELVFKPIANAPVVTRLTQSIDGGELKRFMEAVIEFMKASSAQAPCFGSASKPGEMTDGTLTIATNAPVVVREFGPGGSYTDRVLTDGDELQLDTIEENAITVALYGVEPM